MILIHVCKCVTILHVNHIPTFMAELDASNNIILKEIKLLLSDCDNDSYFEN